MLGPVPPDSHQNLPVPLLPAPRMSGIFSLAQQGLAGRMESAGTGLAVCSSVGGKWEVKYPISGIWSGVQRAEVKGASRHREGIVGLPKRTDCSRCVIHIYVEITMQAVWTGRPVTAEQTHIPGTEPSLQAQGSFLGSKYQRLFWKDDKVALTARGTTSCPVIRNCQLSSSVALLPSQIEKLRPWYQ